VVDTTDTTIFTLEQTSKEKREISAVELLNFVAKSVTKTVDTEALHFRPKTEQYLTDAY